LPARIFAFLLSFPILRCTDARRGLREVRKMLTR
jgi:hypothetical protein